MAAAASIPGVERCAERTVTYMAENAQSAYDVCMAENAQSAYDVCRIALVLAGSVTQRERL